MTDDTVDTEASSAEDHVASGVTPPADPAPSYTIDGLASASGVPSRTIRFYQSKGALMPPQIVGRVAHYGPEHLERLELIGQLKDRGLRIRAITEVMQHIATGEVDIAEWLGIEENLRKPWADDAPQLLGPGVLEKRLEGFAPGSLAALVEYGLVERRDDTYLLRSPGLLDVAEALHSAGVDVELTVDAGRVIEKHVGAMTRDLAQLFIERAGHGFGDKPGDVGASLAVIRKPAMHAVQLLFAKAMQDVLRELIESGGILSPSKGRGRKRGSGRKRR